MEDPIRDPLIEKYLDLKVEARMTDAQSSTSFEEEFRSIYRNGTPKAEAMSNHELRTEIEALESAKG